jgi:hypothetical protein
VRPTTGQRSSVKSEIIGSLALDVPRGKKFALQPCRESHDLDQLLCQIARRDQGRPTVPEKSKRLPARGLDRRGPESPARVPATRQALA